MSRNGFPAACPISPDAIFLGLSILILVTFVIAWAPRCQAGSEIRSGTGMGYTVFATGLAGPRGLLFDPSGDLFAGDTGANRVARVSPDGSVTTYITGLNAPVDLAFHPNGELYVCELYAGTVTAYKSGKKIKVVASGLDKPHGLAFDNTGITYINDGNLFVADAGAGRILKMSGDY